MIQPKLTHATKQKAFVDKMQRPRQTHVVEQSKIDTSIGTNKLENLNRIAVTPPQQGEADHQTIAI